MRIRFGLGVLVLGGLTATCLVDAHAQASLADATALRAAHYKEDVTGDMSGAIADYQRLAKSSDRATAAKALLALGEAYEKSGSKEASAVYARLVRQFADQPQALSAARARLTALSGAHAQIAAPTPRLLSSTTDSSYHYHVSADGRLGVLWRRVPPANFGFAVEDLSTGAVTQIVSPVGTDHVFPPVLSPDDRFLAYRSVAVSTSTPSIRLSTLRLIATHAGAASTEIVAAGNPMGDPSPIAWSPDGSAVLTMFVNASTRTSTMAWVSVADRAIRTLYVFQPGRTFQEWKPGLLSPSGALAAYASTVGSGPAADAHVYVLDLMTRQETDVVRIAGVSSNPLWTPDGSALIFENRRSNRTALWAIPMRGAAPGGEPVMILPDFPGDALGITQANELFFEDQTAPADQARIAVADQRAGEASIAQLFQGEGAGWSPDGKAVAFLVPSAGGDRLLTVRSVETGEEHSYPHAGLGAAQVRWSPDGSSLLVKIDQAVDGHPGGSMYLVDVKTGAFKWLVACGTSDGTLQVNDDFSPDGRTLFMPFTRNGGRVNGIIDIDLASGTQQSIANFDDGGLAGGVRLAISPDGRTLAVLTFTAKPGEDVAARLLTVSTDGTGMRSVYGPFLPGATSLGWTRDGKSILFFTAQGDRGPWRLMEVSSSGGQATFAGLDATRLSASIPIPAIVPDSPLSLDVSREGRLALGLMTAPVRQVWTLDLTRTLAALR